MSQHRKDTPREPSVWWVVLYGSATGVTLALVFAVIGEDTWTWVHLAAVVFGIFTAGALAGLTGHKVLQRGDARIALMRQKAAEDKAVAESMAELRRNTGTWTGDHVGQVLTVRWNPADRTYWVRGWISDHWQQRDERPWADLETLAATLTELETTDELRPADDEGTRMVRSRLDLPGWDSYGTAEPVREPDPEDTAVITWTGAGLPRRDPGAGLR